MKKQLLNQLTQRLLSFLLICAMLLCSGCAFIDLPKGMQETGKPTLSLQNQQTNPPSQGGNAAATLENLPAYSGQAYCELNGNQPDFSWEEMSSESFETYSELDELGRCGVAFANVGQDLMPTEARGSIGQVKPTGWHTVKYDIVDGQYLYNRCHLIGYQLTAENANQQNLITGTRYLNVNGMLPFENMVADFVKETGYHVLYRVTPIFEGENLVATGVEMEAYSVEDDGAGICFHVFVYNVQPGITIDYRTGDSALSSAEVTQAPTAEVTQAPTAEVTQAPTAEVVEIRGNKSSKIYHMPGQADYEKMADSKNLVIFHSEEEAIAAGYRKAQR